eukprot:g50030.t1
MESNPFNNPDEEKAAPSQPMSDPFEDQAIQEASAYHAAAEEYNPFADADDTSWQQKSSTTTRLQRNGASGGYGSNYGSSSSKSSSMPFQTKSSGSSSSSSKGGFPGMDEDAAAARLKELERRERTLAEREAHLREREKESREVQGARMPPNWPFKCYAVAYHDIEAEIPTSYQLLVRHFYAYIYMAWISLGWNWLLLTMAWFSGVQNYTSGDTDFMWGSLYLAFGSVGAWKLWYRSLYYGCRDGSARQWIFFFINFGIHIVFSGIMAVGVPKFAAGGLMFMIKMFTAKANFLGWASLTNSMLWGVNVVSGVYLIKRAHRVWKHSGAHEQTKRSIAEAVLKESLSQSLMSDAA